MIVCVNALNVPSPPHWFCAWVAECLGDAPLAGPWERHRPITRPLIPQGHHSNTQRIRRFREGPGRSSPGARFRAWGTECTVSATQLPKPCIRISMLTFYKTSLAPEKSRVPEHWWNKMPARFAAFWARILRILTAFHFFWWYVTFHHFPYKGALEKV